MWLCVCACACVGECDGRADGSRRNEIKLYSRKCISWLVHANYIKDYIIAVSMYVYLIVSTRLDTTFQNRSMPFALSTSSRVAAASFCHETHTDRRCGGCHWCRIHICYSHHVNCSIFIFFFAPAKNGARRMTTQTEGSGCNAKKTRPTWQKTWSWKTKNKKNASNEKRTNWFITLALTHTRCTRISVAKAGAVAATTIHTNQRTTKKKMEFIAWFWLCVCQSPFFYISTHRVQFHPLVALFLVHIEKIACTFNFLLTFLFFSLPVISPAMISWCGSTNLVNSFSAIVISSRNAPAYTILYHRNAHKKRLHWTRCRVAMCEPHCRA